MRDASLGEVSWRAFEAFVVRLERAIVQSCPELMMDYCQSSYLPQPIAIQVHIIFVTPPDLQANARL